MTAIGWASARARLFNGRSGAGVLMALAAVAPIAAPTSAGTPAVAEPDSIIVTSSLNPANEGDAITFTAVVTWNGEIQERGWLPFLADGVLLGTVAMSGDVNSFTTSALPPGTHQITTNWSLSPSNFMLSSAPLEQVVIARPVPSTTSTTTSTTMLPTTTHPPSPAPTATGMTSSPNPSVLGQPVTFVVTVAGADAAPAGLRGRHGTAQAPVDGGTVTIADAGAVLATVPVVSGRAVFTTSALSAGVHTVTADFSGTATAAPSSFALRQQVDRPAAPTPPTLPATR